MLGRRLLPSLSVAAIAAAALTATAPAAGAARTHRLTTFDSCAQLVRFAHAGAARAGGGVGVPVRAVTGGPAPLERPITEPGPVGVAPTTAPQADVTTTPEYSTTNVQETGIDEPDIVKTDGRRIVTVADGTLRVIDVTGDAPRLAGSLKLDDGGGSEELLLRGDRALVLTTRYAYGSPELPVAAAVAVLPPGTSTTVLTEVDLRDAAAPKVARTMTLPGAYVTARLTGATARIVVSSTPRLIGTRPLTRAPLRRFVPATTIRSRLTGRTYRRGVVPCGAIRRPAVFSGLDLLTVLTVDLDAVMAGAETVYASAASLYVASRRYVPGLQDATDVPSSLRTEIHRFDASRPGQTTYAGSGTVPGFVVNQFALSEDRGVLRVASTDEPSWLPEGGGQPAQSSVTTLKPDGDRLVQVGHVDGLGRGERIYAVRFLGAQGFVVTFRQVDPLYTLDLSDPAAPKVVGELKLAGYSAYLHPLGDGRLLGIGQDADQQGRTEGLQVSLFDVSDLAAPRRLANLVFAQGSSGAEFDHHAFLWWAPAKLAVVPLDAAGFSGAVGVRVAAAALTEAGRLSHRGDDGAVAPIGRSLVVGDRLYTLSWLGLQTATLDTLTPVAFLPLR